MPSSSINTVAVNAHRSSDANPDCCAPIVRPPTPPPRQPIPDTPPLIIGQNQDVLAPRCPNDPSPRRSPPLHKNLTAGLVRPTRIGAFGLRGENGPAENSIAECKRRPIA